jgi:phosphatidylglycerol:prolipoprotein diacylglycerol transferase
VSTVAFVWGATLQFRVEQYALGTAAVFTPAAVLDGGHKLPMGLLVGGIVGLAGALLLRVPWRVMGDALAIGACVIMTVGRIGCFLNGCCSGLACPTWLAPLCPRYGIGSEAHGLQLAHRDILPGTPLSLPVHPLPLYFLAAAGATLLVLLAIRRAGARDGTAGAVFLVTYPALHLALEHLRASTGGSPTTLSALLPTIGIAVGATALAMRLRRADVSATHVPASAGRG